MVTLESERETANIARVFMVFRKLFNYVFNFINGDEVDEPGTNQCNYVKFLLILL